MRYRSASMEGGSQSGRYRQRGGGTIKDKIPGIADLSCGANFSDQAKGYTHGLVVRFTDRSGLETYGPQRSISALCRILSIQFGPMIWPSITSSEAPTMQNKPKEMQL